jgi:hypothetical protein
MSDRRWLSHRGPDPKCRIRLVYTRTRTAIRGVVLVNGKTIIFIYLFVSEIRYTFIG